MKADVASERQDGWTRLDRLVNLLIAAAALLAVAGLVWGL
jgi:hypothetical protein